MVRHFTECDLDALGRRGAVDAMRRFLAATADGETVAPPRHRVGLGQRDLVFTIGGSARADVAGFRLYSIGKDTADPSQLLALLRLSTGEVLATATGDGFGAWRTAALGAVAMQEGTRAVGRPLEVAVLGAGFQAYHHARTWAEATDVARFRAWARRGEAAEAFAGHLAGDTGVPSSAAVSSAAALDGADAVLCVTRSAEPVFDVGDLPDDAYVATVGPKFGGRHELPASCYARAAFLFTDAPAQVRAFEEDPGPLPGGRKADEFTDLAEIVTGRASPPPDGIRLFLSEGLAGTEVALLDAVASRAAE